MPQKNVIVLYKELRTKYIDSEEIDSLLEGTEISILKDFLNNWDVIEEFNHKFYGISFPKTVLCGINPGKNGAGKTGIPFLDFTSLSKMIDGVHRTDTERSAQFFYDVIQKWGEENFYKSFYVTNISWVGYVKGNRNLNYYDLPKEAKAFVYKMFKLEMESIAPITLISLSQEVKKTVDEIFGESNIDTNHLLPHPNYCAFPTKYENCKRQYIELLSRYVKA